jgi:hypothetical protein
MGFLAWVVIKLLSSWAWVETSKYCAFTLNNKHEKDFKFNSQDLFLLQDFRCYLLL